MSIADRLTIRIAALGIIIADFEARLVDWRERQNQATARAREMLGGDTNDVPDPKQWAATIIAAGQVYLRRGEHLRPAGAGLTGRRGRVLSCDRQRPPGCSEGWSDVAAFAACSVGLFEDAMGRIVDAWMRQHGVTDPTMPWRIACQIAGELELAALSALHGADRAAELQAGEWHLVHKSTAEGRVWTGGSFGVVAGSRWS